MSIGRGKIVLATMLSPMGAAVCAALAVTVVGVWTGWIRGPAWGGFIMLAVLGSIFYAPFSIVFALLTQLPLTKVQISRGRWPGVLHVAVSALLGVAWFFCLGLIAATLSGRDITLPPGFAGPEFMMPVVIGFFGGAGVGLLWVAIVPRVRT